MSNRLSQNAQPRRSGKIVVNPYEFGRYDDMSPALIHETFLSFGTRRPQIVTLGGHQLDSAGSPL